MVGGLEDRYAAVSDAVEEFEEQVRVSGSMSGKQHALLRELSYLLPAIGWLNAWGRELALADDGLVEACMLRAEKLVQELEARKC